MPKKYMVPARVVYAYGEGGRFSFKPDTRLWYIRPSSWISQQEDRFFFNAFNDVGGSIKVNVNRMVYVPGAILKKLWAHWKEEGEKDFNRQIDLLIHSN